MSSASSQDDFELPATLPLVPVRDRVVCPFMIVPLVVSRKASAYAVEEALRAHAEHLVLVMTQRDPGLEDPSPEELHPVGCVATIVQMDRLRDGRVKILVQGLVRARVEAVLGSEPCLMVRPSRVHDTPIEDGEVRVQALLRSSKENLERYAEEAKDIPEQLPLILRPVEDPGRLADLITSHLELTVDDAQALLEVNDPVDRLRQTNAILERELGIREMQKRIEARAREQMSRSQREFFLRQQMRAIRTELGDEAAENELDVLRGKIDAAGMPPEALDEALRLLHRLRRLPAEGGEAGVVRTALERMAAIPWSVRTDDNLDLAVAREVLDRDHHGLEEIKERILDFLAVRRLKPDGRGPVLCFTGPPGVGKTSLGRAIATAMGRRFCQASLGGIHDDAAIRGHRRTYVGSMPGRIVQGLRLAGSLNPVFMLDEVDKLGSKVGGDPAAALLEVLDPAQNHAFRDAYLDVPLDLSNVLFICTANLVDAIPGPLRDRMEVIHLPGYTEEEKLEIARRHILPRAMDDHGLEPGHLHVARTALQRVIRDYTSEAGLRALERRVAAICRKVARAVAEGKRTRTRITTGRLDKLLGPPRPALHALAQSDEVGVVVGLAWTATGGEILPVEASRMRGKGGLTLTGQLGEVMKESAHAALSFLRSRAHEYGIDAEFFTKHEVHVHVPAGAIPKDGPSAGVTIATALASVVLGVPVRHDVAMTGEITLRGHVLPVGGLKPKVMAAVRAGLRTILVPAGNWAEVELLPPGLRRGVEIIPCATVEEVFTRALSRDQKTLKLAGAG